MLIHNCTTLQGSIPDLACAFNNEVACVMIATLCESCGRHSSNTFEEGAASPTSNLER